MLQDPVLNPPSAPLVATPESTPSPLSPFLKTPASTGTEIRLLGQRMILKNEEIDPAELQAILALVTERLSAAEAKNKAAAAHHIALLALLELAEDYLKAKKKTESFKQQVHIDSQQILLLLETCWR